MCTFKKNRIQGNIAFFVFLFVFLLFLSACETSHHHFGLGEGTAQPEVDKTQDVAGDQPVVPAEEFVVKREIPVEVEPVPADADVESAKLVVEPDSSQPVAEVAEPRAPGKKVRVSTFKRPLRVRVGPSLEAKVVSAVQRNAIVQVVGEEEQWFLVEYEAGKTGWIFKKFTSDVK